MATSTIRRPAPDLASLRDEQSRLRDRLARARRSLVREMVLEFLLDLVALTVAAATILVAVDAWLRLAPSPREVLLTAAGLAIVATLILRTRPRLHACQLDDLGLAMTLDRYRPGTGQQVADVLQLPGELDDPRSPASPSLVRLAVQRASAALDAADWSRHWNHRRTVSRALTLLAIVLVPVAFARLLPDIARLSVARWLTGSDERWPQRTYLMVSGLGDRRELLAPRDEPFAIEVRSDLPDVASQDPGWWSIPGRGEPFAIRRRPATPDVPESVRIRELTAEGATRLALMTVTGPSRFRHELPPSSTSSKFDLTGGDDWLGPIDVIRVDRPTLESTRLRVRDPNTPANAFRPIQDTRQHLIFLPDTEIELTLIGSEPIERTRVEVHPGATPEVTRLDGRSFRARWVLHEATTLEVQLTSTRTGLTSKPSFLSLGILKDREPRVTLRAQGVGAHVTPIATVPLSIAATDDLGLSAIRLQIERTTYAEEKATPQTTKQTVPLPLAVDGGRVVLDHQARHDLDLQISPPAVGTIIRIQAEAEDRSARGTQIGRSGTVNLQVVSADELFYEILIRQRAERAKFIAALAATEKQTPLLAGTPTAEDYTGVVRTLHTSTRQLDQIAARIGDSLAEMKLNQVGSPKSHRLLQEGVIEPLRSLNAGPISELRSTLQTLAGGGSRTATETDKARKQHGEVVSRMKVILDQMSQWESFVDVVNQVAEVIKMQQKVLKATETARESRTQEVFDDKP